MKNIGKALVSIAFVLAFLGAAGSMISMTYDLVQPVVDGAHFIIASIAFVLCAVFFLVLHKEVEYY